METGVPDQGYLPKIYKRSSYIKFSADKGLDENIYGKMGVTVNVQTLMISSWL